MCKVGYHYYSRSHRSHLAHSRLNFFLSRPNHAIRSDFVSHPAGIRGIPEKMSASNLYRGSPRTGSKQLAVGRVLGGKKVYLSVSEASPNQLEYLGVELPFFRKGGLTWELVGCTIEFAWDMNGAKRPQMLLSPKEEMVGKLRHVMGA